MKIWEIDWTDGKKYRDIDGKIWTVENGELYDEKYSDLPDLYNMETILKFEFNIVD